MRRWLRRALAVVAGLVVVVAAVLVVTVRIRVHDDQPPDPTSVGDNAAEYALVHDVQLADARAIIDYCSQVASQADLQYQQTLMSYGDSVDDGCVSTLLHDLRR